MSKTPKPDIDDALDEQTLQMLSDAPAALNTATDRMQGLRSRVMQRVDDDIADVAQAFLTVHHHDGVWIEIAPKIKKKVLFENLDSGIEAYFLRAEAGAELDPHLHEYDEHCIVLEGELTIGDSIHLKKGDYHFARAGSKHGVSRTDVGVMVYIQTGPQGLQPTL